VDGIGGMIVAVEQMCYTYLAEVNGTGRFVFTNAAFLHKSIFAHKPLLSCGPLASRCSPQQRQHTRRERFVMNRDEWMARYERMYTGDKKGNCSYCHKRKAGQTSFRGFCSWECVDADFDLFPEEDRNPCLGCGKPIVTKNLSRKYCSEQCHRNSIERRVPIPAATYKFVYERDDYTCQYCGDRAEHLDHILPFSKGGDNCPANLVSACATCNLTAHDRVFLNFEDKKKWILKARGMREKKLRKEKETRHPDWHSRVYGSSR
jgi:5-methylcytosine-specific restriction endonuclease McrA